PLHRALGRHGIRILESLRLEGVPEGKYELIALPLKLPGADGSPVRAVLRG
ncbi:MAG TPA: kynurenine formamidase, partial [Armatimonadota bacterium]|nr:kynurenine formamidase [Armatimonadota bacterium]